MRATAWTPGSVKVWVWERPERVAGGLPQMPFSGFPPPAPATGTVVPSATKWMMQQVVGAVTSSMIGHRLQADVRLTVDRDLDVAAAHEIAEDGPILEVTDLTIVMALLGLLRATLWCAERRRSRA